jgi:membrane fusion protein, multidrug efflux system
MRRRARRFATFLVACMTQVSSSIGAQSEELQLKPVRGVLRAEAAAVVSSELVARVTGINRRAGEKFKAGEVLLTFDCSRYLADLRASEADVKTQEITVETNRQLLRHRAAGSNDLALAEAKLAQATAAADSLRVRTAQCTINAPYDGHLVERVVDVFEMPQPNSPLLKIVKHSQLEVDLILPSEWVVRVKPGSLFHFAVDETKTTHSARLLHLGAVIDPVSRTIRATGQLMDAAPELRPGMSGAGTFSIAISGKH